MMARFYVGQRVRVARSTAGMHKPGYNPIIVPGGALGREGIIVGTESCPNAGFAKDGPFDVSLRLDSGEMGMAPSCCLEPITDANDLVSWESMRGLWLPEQYRVVA